MKVECEMNIKLGVLPYGKKKVLTMSYDDGGTDDRRLVEIFNKNGIKGTFHLNSARCLEATWAVSVDEAIQIYSGHEISCHCANHPNMTECSDEQNIDEILQDRKTFENRCGYVLRGMSYPYGCYNDRVIENCRSAGMVYSRTVCSTESFDFPENFLMWHPTAHHNNERLFELLDSFLANDTDELKLMYIWGHSFEFGNDNNWDRIEEFCKKAGGKDDVWYATNIEIYDYYTNMYKLNISADGTVINNPTGFEIWFYADGNLMSVDAGQTVRLGEN